MEIRNAGDLAHRAETMGDGVRVTQLHPEGHPGDAIVAVDLWELEPGGHSNLTSNLEEHIMFVISGTGELSGAAEGGAKVVVKPNSVVHIGHREDYAVRNTDREPLRLLVSTPLLVKSDRSLGITQRPALLASSLPSELARFSTQAAEESEPAPSPRSRLRIQEREPVVEPSEGGASLPDSAAGPDEEQEQAPPDISLLVKPASQVAVTPRSERRKPVPEPEPEEQSEEQPAPEEEESQASAIELHVVFDGGSRGNPGQGYGSFLVQSPNRKPIIKRLEFGDNYTNNQAEYDSLIGALNYIVERLEATNRSPEQVSLDIKTDSDLVVNQLMGTFKVKDAGLRARHAQASDLLDRFAAWIINWHPRAESVKLLGH